MQVTKDGKMHKKEMKNPNLDADRWVKAGSARYSKVNLTAAKTTLAAAKGEPQDQMKTKNGRACSL